MARSYIPAWQRVVLIALNQTAWDEMKPDEQQAVLAFIAEKNKADDVKTDMLLQQTLNRAAHSKRMPLGVLILLGVLALIAAPLLTLALGTKWLVPALAACIVWELCTAKKTRMRRIWQDREPGGEGTAMALKRMYLTALDASLAAANKVKLGVMLVALVLLVVLWAIPEPPPSAAKTVAAKVGEVTAGEATLSDALALLPEGLDGIDTARQAMKYTAHSSDEELLLAALMWRHIEADDQLLISDYATGAAGTPMYEVLANTAPAEIDNPEEIVALALLLKYAGAQQEATLTRFLQQKTLPDGLLNAFGSAMQAERTLPELLSLCDGIAAAGHDPAAFLTPGVLQLTFAEATQAITGTDDAHRPLLIRAYAPALTALDDVLAFLRLAKEYGVSAAECYPDGATIDLDTSRWDPYRSPQADSLGSRDTFLILHRTEQPEPYTTCIVPEEQETGRNAPLPDHLYEDYDPDASLGAAQYTVVLDTAALDVMPTACIPESLGDCDALVILDSWYFCDGYVRFTRSVADEDGGWKQRQIDSPCFGVCQEIAVYSARSGDWLFSAQEHVVNSPAMLNENLPTRDVLAWNPADQYIASPDEAWMAEARADYLKALERRGWRLVP